MRLLHLRPDPAFSCYFGHVSQEHESELDSLEDQQEEERINEEDDEDEELSRQEKDDEKEETIYSDDMRAG